uniref:Uncharacterized protein n=1 Tax=Paramormyrops kingsleyae TaxID=1676925 RepID=A0A3B3SCP1_9TELE
MSPFLSLLDNGSKCCLVQLKPAPPDQGSLHVLKIASGGTLPFPTYSPVYQLPVLSTPVIPVFFHVHSSHPVHVRLVDPQQAKSIHLPVA